MTQCAFIGLDGEDIQCSDEGTVPMVWDGCDVGMYCEDHAQYQEAFSDSKRA